MSAACMVFDLVSNVTVVAHFPTSRGLTIALLKSYVGIGSSIIGTVRLAFFMNPTHFFYFLFALSVATAIVLASVLRLPSYHLTGYEVKHLPQEVKEQRLATKAQYLRQRVPKWGQVYLFVLLLVSIVYLLVASASTTYLALGPAYKKGFAIASIALALLVLVLCFPLHRVGPPRRDDADDEDLFDEPRHDAIEPSFAEERGGASEAGRVAAPKETNIDYIAPQYQTTFRQSLLTLRFWAIIWTLFCLTGTEFTVIFYSSYIYGAINGKQTSDDMRTLLSVLNGAGSAVGRLLIALFEHVTQNRPPEQRIAVTWAPMIPSAFMTIALVLFLTLPPAALPLAFIILAFANGSQAAMTALVPRTIYAKDAAKHYQFQFISCILSAIVLVRYLYAEWYNRLGVKNGNPNGYCFGRSCILMPFCVQLGLVCSTYVSNLYVCWRYAQYSRRVLAERARIVGEPRSSVDGEDAPKKEQQVVGEPFPLSLREISEDLADDSESERK
ncbi:hypothetical protein STCU_08487 [Strigomonas culicis]|uniref:Nodulin-like domain-containing protein n=1 Tax=Strigomonas culicis TaxID=28005 RepID=S9VF76_9TRYP|nr:hypothetical protein STCU_08487 [Strigomonas culicis]|eukprot:EPY21790.1 hypothetical protein STCU_08487 [Strigomonas culicis]